MENIYAAIAGGALAIFGVYVAHFLNTRSITREVRHKSLEETLSSITDILNWAYIQAELTRINPKSYEVNVGLQSLPISKMYGNIVLNLPSLSRDAEALQKRVLELYTGLCNFVEAYNNDDPPKRPLTTQALWETHIWKPCEAVTEAAHVLMHGIINEGTTKV